MTREQKRPIVEGGPPLGSAPGYGDVTENVVGDQGQPDLPPPQDSDSQRVQKTPLYKEELLPEEKGTSLDEGGAG